MSPVSAAADPGSPSPSAQQPQVLLAEAQSSALPAPLAIHSAWETFHQKLCAPPAVNLQPSSGRRPSTLPPSAALDGDITQQEVELALPKLSNGKAVGGAGWPAELLRHAAYYVIMEDGSRHKVWVLTPLLTRLPQPLLLRWCAAVLHLLSTRHSNSQEGLHP